MDEKYTRDAIQNIYIDNLASDLKEKLGELEIERDGATIASLHSVNMHPLIKPTTTRKAVIFFTRGLTAATKKNQPMLGANLLLDELHLDIL